MYLLGDNPVKSSFPWLTLAPITQTFGANGETGTDFALDLGTPVTALVSGYVGGAGYDPSGGYLSILFAYNGQPTALYYQHMDQVVRGAGEYVKIGDLIGYSGGQLAGGHHPSSPQSSSGPHIELGVNFPWGGGRNPEYFRPSFDPLPLLRELAGGQPLSGIGGFGAGVVASVSTAPGFGTLAQALNDTMQFQGMSADPLQWPSDAFRNAEAFFSRSIFVLLGVAVILAVMYQLTAGPRQLALRVAAAAA